MDNTMGVETEMTNRGNGGINAPDQFDYPPRRSRDRSLPVPESERPNSPPATTANDFLNETFEAAPSDYFPEAPVSGWEVIPSMTREQHENAQKISADFVDAAWVSSICFLFFF
jgi:hypothetical protein